MVPVAKRRSDAQYLGYGASPIQSNNNQQQQNLMNNSTHASQPPPPVHEYICGVYRPAQSPAAVTSEQAPPAPNAAPSAAP